MEQVNWCSCSKPAWFGGSGTHGIDGSSCQEGYVGGRRSPGLWSGRVIARTIKRPVNEPGRVLNRVFDCLAVVASTPDPTPRHYGDFASPTMSSNPPFLTDLSLCECKRARASQQVPSAFMTSMQTSAGTPFCRRETSASAIPSSSKPRLQLGHSQYDCITK